LHGFGGENVNDNNGKSIHRYKYNIEIDFIHIDGYLAWILSRGLNDDVFMERSKFVEYPLGNYMLDL
jgi:hypothetical protein